MNQIWELLDGASSIGGPFSAESVILSLLLAFVLGQVLAWVYCFTHSGLSYSKTFVQSLILIAVIVAVIMAVIGNNIVTAFGLMGALAMIRFRNVVKDTRDIAFVFSVLVVGMAAGSQRYAIAVVGTLFLSFVTIYMHLTQFGTRRPHNGFLRFTSESHLNAEHPVIEVLNRFCSQFTMISAQNEMGGERVEYAYQLMIRRNKKNEQMIAELEDLNDIGNISLTIQEQLLDV